MQERDTSLEGIRQSKRKTDKALRYILNLQDIAKAELIACTLTLLFLIAIGVGTVYLTSVDAKLLFFEALTGGYCVLMMAGFISLVRRWKTAKEMQTDLELMNAKKAENIPIRRREEKTPTQPDQRPTD